MSNSSTLPQDPDGPPRRTSSGLMAGSSRHRRPPPMSRPVAPQVHAEAVTAQRGEASRDVDTEDGSTHARVRLAISRGIGFLQPGDAMHPIQKALTRHGWPSDSRDKLVAESMDDGSMRLHWVSQDIPTNPGQSLRARRELIRIINERLMESTGANEDTPDVLFPEQRMTRMRGSMERCLEAGEVGLVVARLNNYLKLYADESTPELDAALLGQGLHAVLRFAHPLPRRSYLAAVRQPDDSVVLQNRLEEPDAEESVDARGLLAQQLRQLVLGMQPVSKSPELLGRLKALLQALAGDGDGEPLTVFELGKAVTDVARELQASTLRGRYEAVTPPFPTATEAMAELIDGLDRAREDATPAQRATIDDVDARARHLWLSEGTQPQRTASFMKAATTRLQKAGVQGPADIARKMADELARPRDPMALMLRQHDNDMGRKLEQFFARNLDADPSPAMLQGARDIGIAVAEMLAGLQGSEGSGVYREAMTMLGKDHPRPWVRDGDEVSRLMSAPESDLQMLRDALLAPVKNGDDIKRVQLLATKTSAALGDFAPATHEWARASTENHRTVVIPGRGVEKYFDSHRDPTPGDGLDLRHQRTSGPAAASSPTRKTSAERVFEFAHDTPRDPEVDGPSTDALDIVLKPANRRALDHGRPVVGGQSSTAGLMLGLLDEMKTRPGPALRAELERTGRAGFDARGGFLGHANWLARDSGHSLHEALWAVNQRAEALGFDWLGDPQPADDFDSDYQAYFDSLDPASREHAERAMDRAWQDLLAYRRAGPAAA